jgi:hypothetical protein
VSSDAGREDIESGRELRLQPTVAHQQPLVVLRDPEHFRESEGFQRVRVSVCGVIVEMC